jgi:hypothetical protein
MEFLSWIYAAFITGFGAWYIYSVTFKPIPEGNEQMTHTILGFVMGTMITTALSFVFNIATRYIGGEKNVTKTKPIEVKPDRTDLAGAQITLNP